jgi:hypothetical protein
MALSCSLFFKWIQIVIAAVPPHPWREAGGKYHGYLASYSIVIYITLIHSFSSG